MAEELEKDKQAFPFYAQANHQGNPGMSLYDYYLGKAVIAISNIESDSRYTPEEIASRSDRLAMALLKARAARNGTNDGKSL